jgi:hypothetical protein
MRPIRWQCQCGETGEREQDYHDEEIARVFFACPTCGQMIFEASFPAGSPLVRVLLKGATAEVADDAAPA